MKELWAFLRVRKRYWLAPILITLALLAILVILANDASVQSPFVYQL